ncbi:MAG: hypothetical protein IKE70_02205, partial [Bacilli bacterium]|nr:hypothetical protein [Bacilli bacterium]
MNTIKTEIKNQLEGIHLTEEEWNNVWEKMKEDEDLKTLLKECIQYIRNNYPNKYNSFIINDFMENNLKNDYS